MLLINSGNRCILGLDNKCWFAFDGVWVRKTYLKKNPYIEKQKKKLENDIQRAMSQVAQLNKERDGLLKNYDALKRNYERDVSQAQEAEPYRNT